MMRATLIALSFTLGFLCIAPPAGAQDKATADQAMAVFTSQKCTLCHSIGLKGNPKGSLDGVGATLKADEIRQWINDPEGMRSKTHATRTPAMKPLKLSKEQVNALVAYLQTLKSPALNATNASK